jgi:hypothetical protein
MFVCNVTAVRELMTEEIDDEQLALRLKICTLLSAVQSEALSDTADELIVAFEDIVPASFSRDFSSPSFYLRNEIAVQAILRADGDKAHIKEMVEQFFPAEIPADRKMASETNKKKAEIEQGLRQRLLEYAACKNGRWTKSVERFLEDHSFEHLVTGLRNFLLHVQAVNAIGRPVLDQVRAMRTVFAPDRR